MKDDITKNYHGGNALSVLANEGVKAKASDRARIIRLLNSHSNGLTCDEVEATLGMRHQTVSARLTELKRDNLVVVNGRRRTRAGSTAGVNCVRKSTG